MIVYVRNLQITRLVTIKSQSRLKFHMRTINRLIEHDAFKSTVASSMIITGIIALVLAFGLKAEFDSQGITDYISLSDEMKQEIQPKIQLLIIDFIYGVIMLPLGIRLMLTIIFNKKYRQRNYSRERKLAYFNTQFNFLLLIIAVLISFSIDSMNDDRPEFMYMYGGSAIAVFVALVIYRQKKLYDIFDSSHDIQR